MAEVSTGGSSSVAEAVGSAGAAVGTPIAGPPVHSVGCALMLAIVGSAANNIGKVLQKRATAELPQLALDGKTMRAYLANPAWLRAVGADVGGALLTLASLSMAPISLIQPVSGCGIAILATFSHYYLREELQRVERVGVGVAMLGTVGIGLTASPPEPALPDLLAFVGCVLALGALFGALEAAAARAAAASARRSQQRDKPPRLQSFAATISSPLASAMTSIHDHYDPAAGADQSHELLAGAQAGLLFGLSSTSARTGMLVGQLSPSVLASAAPALGVACSVLLSAAGIFCQNRGMKDGRAVLVCTVAAVATIVTGVAAGIVALNETLPAEHPLGWLVSLMSVLLGVFLLMRRAPVAQQAPAKLAKDDKEIV